MKNNTGQYNNYSIDDWINFFIKKKDADPSDSKKRQTNNVINLLKRIKNNGDIINPMIYMHIKLINDAFIHTFDSWEYEIIKTESTVILFNDIVFLELYEDDDNIYCHVGFGYKTEPYIVSYIILALNNIFNTRINIIESVFMINTLDGSFIWGMDKIKNFKNISKGYKKFNQHIVHNVVDENGNIIKGHC